MTHYLLMCYMEWI